MLVYFRRKNLTYMVFFFLAGAPLNLVSVNPFTISGTYVEKFQASLHGILYLENLGGLESKKPTI